MRLSILVICIVSLGIASCKKSSSPANTNPPPPPPNSGNGGPSAKVTITGISPLKAYQGDVITITGTGFDPDRTKDTVLIGSVKGLSPGFTPGGNAIHFFSTPKTTIISATATTLTFTTDSTVLFTDPPGAYFAFQVSTPAGINYTADTLLLKSLPRIVSVTSSDPYPKAVCDSWKIFAGDSIFISGRGLYPPLTITIDGHAMDYLRFFDNPASDFSNLIFNDVTGFIGPNYFGRLPPLPDNQCVANNSKYFKTVKVVNGDGRSATFNAGFYAGANTHFADFQMSQPQYSRTKDGSGVLTVSGYGVRDFTLELVGVDPVTHAQFIKAEGGSTGDLAGTFTTTINFGDLPDPTPAGSSDYNIYAKDVNGTRIGGAHFALFP